MKNKTSFKQALLLIFGPILLFLFVWELAYRVEDFAKGRGFIQCYRNRIPNLPILPFRSFGKNLYVNVNGVKFISSVHGERYSLQKDKSTYRVVCFGGSTTVNQYCYSKTSLHYPKILEENLSKIYPQSKIEVINIGNSGYSTPHLLILLELDVISWRPNLVILSENINDLLKAYFHDFTYDYSHAYSKEFFNPLQWLKNLSGFAVIMQHSNLYWKAKGWIGKKSRIPCKRVNYGDKPPEQAREAFKRNLESFIALAKHNGIKVIMASQPLQPSEEYWYRHMAHKPYNNVVLYPMHNEFLKHHATYNNCIKEVAEKNSVYFLDNDAIFEGKKEYFIDFIHYSIEGVRKLAANYTEVFIENKIIYPDYSGNRELRP